VNKMTKISQKRSNGKKSGDKAIMTCDEVAEFLRVHVSSVRRWSRCGKLRAFKVGGRGDWRYRKQDVLAFLYDTSYTESKGQGQGEVIGMIKA